MAERLFLRLDGDPLYADETSVPQDTLREFAVLPALREHVAHIAAYREDIAPGHELVERVLPDGAVHLIFHGGDAPSAAAAGAVAAPTLVRLAGRVDGLSVTLRPGAAAALLGRPASEIAGSAVPLVELWRGDADALLGRLAEATDDTARNHALQAALLRRLAQASARGDNARRQAMHAARQLAHAGRQAPLHAVAAALGVGERRLQQVFQSQVGLTPRAFGRLLRLHACLRALRRQAAPRWSHLAVDAGFYDQSHLVNEFQALCGLTPGQFLEQRRNASGSSKTAG